MSLFSFSACPETVSGSLMCSHGDAWLHGRMGSPTTMDPVAKLSQQQRRESPAPAGELNLLKALGVNKDSAHKEDPF